MQVRPGLVWFGGLLWKMRLGLLGVRLMAVPPQPRAGTT